MLSCVFSQIITSAMASAGEGGGNKVVVSKRSARTYIEDGMELAPTTTTADKQLQPLVRSGNTKQDMMAEEFRGRKSSASMSSSGQSSRQTSIEAMPAAAAMASGKVVEWGRKKELVVVAVGKTKMMEGRGHGNDDAVLSGILESTNKLNNGGNSGDGLLVETALSEQQSALRFDETLPKTGRPANFGVVVPGVYRSSFPQADDHDFIARLGLKTIVTLVQKDFPEGYDAFIRNNGIKHQVFDMRGTKKEKIPDKTMKAILGLIMNRANHPLLIHCNHGKHRTGCVVAVVRILTGWDMGHVVDEYRSFAEPKVRECDIEYIMGFEPARISNLFVRDGIAQARFKRAVCFVVVVLLVWVASGRGFTSVGGQAVEGRLL